MITTTTSIMTPPHTHPSTIFPSTLIWVDGSISTAPSSTIMTTAAWTDVFAVTALLPWLDRFGAALPPPVVDQGSPACIRMKSVSTTSSSVILTSPLTPSSLQYWRLAFGRRLPSVQPPSLVVGSCGCFCQKAPPPPPHPLRTVPAFVGPLNVRPCIQGVT